jgi:hypothetical protein
MKKFSNISDVRKVIVNRFWDHNIPRRINKEDNKNGAK